MDRDGPDTPVIMYRYVTTITQTLRKRYIVRNLSKFLTFIFTISNGTYMYIV
jgi:hypothetical protein